MRTVVVLILATAAAAFAQPAVPPNDDCQTATRVTAVPFTETVDTRFAHPGYPDENYLSCGPGGGGTVWYEFVPPASGSYCAKTCGSDYDTVVSVIQGGCLGDEIACDDDTCFFESDARFQAAAGVPVKILVGQFSFVPVAVTGGFLTMSILNENADTDGDGINDCDDGCPANANPIDGDADDDGVGDTCDPCDDIGEDLDGDGICGYLDRCPYLNTTNQADADNDFVGDVCEACAGPGGWDPDGDGACDDVSDNCSGVFNPSQADTDGDGVGDACDACSGPGGVDADGDGVCDDTVDNCPGVANPDQLDSDGDLIGDACDQCPGFFGSGTVDTDGDSRPDVCDACPDDPTDACATMWACVAPVYDGDLIPSTLVRVNPATGVASAVGSLGTSGCRGLAFQPGTGILFALARSTVVADTWDLFHVDTTTAAMTRVGPTAGLEGESTPGIAFRADGTLFSVINDETVTIDPSTGTATVLGTPFYAYPGGLTFDGAGTTLEHASAYELSALDQSTGEPTSLAYLDPDNLACPDGLDVLRGLTFADGALRASFTCYGYPYTFYGVLDGLSGAITGFPGVQDLTALTAERCGNGTVEGAEECDDGNTVGGDCCSPTCRATPPGGPCDDDGSACTTDVCDGAGTCTHLVPASACTSATPGKAVLSVTPGADPKLTWRWRGTITNAADFGTPATTTSLTLCLVGSGGTLLADASAPAGGLCQHGAPCWKPKSQGVDYVDHDRTPDGIDKLSLRAAPTPGRAKLKAKGRGPSLVVPATPYTTPVRVRLVRDDGGGCWEAVYSTPSRNDARGFKATSD